MGMSMHHCTRRNFLKATAFAGGSAAISGCLGPSRQARGTRRRKPNLLFIWTDEQRADTMAAYGNRKIRVPNLNRLASKSVVFEKAYVTQPVCTPNRAAVMTGLWPHTSGCIKNNIPLRRNTPCLPELLNDPDYRTAYMGKWHLGNEIFAQHGFEEWVSMEDGYSKYYSQGRDRNKRSDYHHFLIDKGYEPDSGTKFSRTFAARRPIEHCKPKFLEIKACEFLRHHRNEPFILYINFLEPHMPFTGPFDEMYDPAYVDLPANFNDPLEDNEPSAYRKKREEMIKKYGPDEQSFRELIARYWGLVSQVDASVGKILDTLERLGQADNTIVVYTSDHGDMMGSHRMVTKGVMYEEAARIPWLMRVPWMTGKQRMVAQPVSQIDMVPTLLELMGRNAQTRFPGHSLVPLMQGRKAAEDHVFIQWNGDVTTRTVVTTDGWKLCLSRGDKSQLFNLNKDPGETINLFDSGQHRGIIDRLTKKIHEWQEKVQDTVKV